MSESTPRGVFGGSAWSVGRVAGIQVAIDHTWIFIFLLVTLSLGAAFRAGHEDWSGPLVWGTAAVTSLLFFASILLHELGHSLVAQRLGVGVKSITLFIFGGVAALDREPDRPRDEVFIAVAGPAVSLALGLGFLAIGGMSSGALGEASGWLGRINLMVAAFNCVPGFPLDGGRVLRGAVWHWTGSFERATAIAAMSGSLFAYTLIGLGIFSALLGGQLLGGLWLVFIGWFLLSAARASVSQMVLERVLARVRADQAMESVEGRCVDGGRTVGDLVAHAVLVRGLRTFYVVDADRTLRGLVTLRELAGGDAEQRALTRIEDVMVPVAKLEVLAPDDDGWQALRRMAERGVNQLPVLEAGRLLGQVTRERLLALVQAQLALGSDAAARAQLGA